MNTDTRLFDLGTPRFWRLCSVMMLSVAVAGCFSSRAPDAKCNAVSEYQSSTTVPAIVIPDGLTAPPESGSFTIPPDTQVADQKSDQGGVPGAACLARPPDYFRKEAMPASK